MDGVFTVWSVTVTFQPRRHWLLCSIQVFVANRNTSNFYRMRYAIVNCTINLFGSNTIILRDTAFK
jgi:hypothetical protein